MHGWRPAGLHRADRTRAQQHLARAARLRPLLTYSIPTLAVKTLLELPSLTTSELGMLSWLSATSRAARLGSGCTSPEHREDPAISVYRKVGASLGQAVYPLKELGLLGA